MHRTIAKSSSLTGIVIIIYAMTVDIIKVYTQNIKMFHSNLKILYIWIEILKNHKIMSNYILAKWCVRFMQLVAELCGLLVEWLKIKIIKFANYEIERVLKMVINKNLIHSEKPTLLETEEKIVKLCFLDSQWFFKA